VNETTYKLFANPATKLKQSKKRKSVKIDKELDTPMGKVVFRGELSDEELDAVVTMGLVTMLLQGQISATFMTEDGTLIQDVPDQVQ